jgi:glycyl-tRNA synthetase
MFLAVLSASLKNETLDDGSSRIVLSVPPALAPVKAAIFPLVRKDGLPEKAMEIFNALRFNFNLQYEEKDSIGKRYRRHDAIGTPFCITVDHQTLDDNSVTIRERDSMEQKRVEIIELYKIVSDEVSMSNLLKKLESRPKGRNPLYKHILQ